MNLGFNTLIRKVWELQNAKVTWNFFKIRSYKYPLTIFFCPPSLTKILGPLLQVSSKVLDSKILQFRFTQSNVY